MQEEPEIQSFERANTEYIGRSLKLVRLMGMLWPTLETHARAGPSSSCLVGGREVLQHRINVGEFRGLQHLHGAVDVAHHRPGMGDQHFPARHGFDGTHSQIFDEQPEITDACACRRIAPSEISGDIEFRDLSFRYGNTIERRERGRALAGDELVLKDVNLGSGGNKPGDRGADGSGKSTLVSLIPRIYDAEAGFGADRWPAGSRISA